MRKKRNWGRREVWVEMGGEGDERGRSGVGKLGKQKVDGKVGNDEKERR